MPDVSGITTYLGAATGFKMEALLLSTFLNQEKTLMVMAFGKRIDGDGPSEPRSFVKVLSDQGSNSFIPPRAREVD